MNLEAGNSYELPQIENPENLDEVSEETQEIIDQIHGETEDLSEKLPSRNDKAIDLIWKTIENPEQLGTLFLKDPESQEPVDQEELRELGNKFILNFNTQDQERRLGIGDLLPHDVVGIRVTRNSENHKEKQGEVTFGIWKDGPRKPGYYDLQGNYLPVWSGDMVEITNVRHEGENGAEILSLDQEIDTDTSKFFEDLKSQEEWENKVSEYKKAREAYLQNYEFADILGGAGISYELFETDERYLPEEILVAGDSQVGGLRNSLERQGIDAEGYGGKKLDYIQDQISLQDLQGKEMFLLIAGGNDIWDFTGVGPEKGAKRMFERFIKFNDDLRSKGFSGRLIISEIMPDQRTTEMGIFRNQLIKLLNPLLTEYADQNTNIEFNPTSDFVEQGNYEFRDTVHLESESYSRFANHLGIKYVETRDSERMNIMINSGEKLELRGNDFRTKVYELAQLFPKEAKSKGQFLTYVNSLFDAEMTGDEQPLSMNEIDNEISKYFNGSESESFKTTFNLIAKLESGDNYYILGDEIVSDHEYFPYEFAIGKYQIMPSNWLVWSRQYLGEGTHSPTPANQDRVAMGEIAKYYAEFRDLRPQDRAFATRLSWFAGVGNGREFANAIRGGKSAEQAIRIANVKDRTLDIDGTNIYRSFLDKYNTA